MTKYLFLQGLFLMFVQSKTHKNESKFFIINLVFSPPQDKKIAFPN